MTDTGTAPVPTLTELEASLDLGTRFLQAMQRAAGNFEYEYDWQRRAYSELDNQVRQAATLWGLTVILSHRADPALAQTCRAGLEFFAAHSACNEARGRYVRYPDAEIGQMGTVALVALSILEYLRAGAAADRQEYERWDRQLDEYLRFLVDGRHPSGLWFGSYTLAEGVPTGAPSPYYDGESLLALSRAARHLDRGELVDEIMQAAASGYRRNVLLALRNDPGAPTVRTYYQWATMAYYEMVEAAWSGTEQYVDVIYYMTDHMVHACGIARSQYNTGATLEGVVHALALAVRRGDELRAREYRDVVEQGLANALSLQIGAERANAFIRGGAPWDEPAIGGVQHYPDRPLLRIDFAQHQLHAVLLALSHLF
jgi:hypothetical protein